MINMSDKEIFNMLNYVMTCKRCGHKWLPRVIEIKTCPKCRSPYWNKERKNNVKTP